MVATRGQRKAAKRRRTEKEQPSDFNLEETASVLPPNPLSILVTLAHIFSFLKPVDLERCSQVNRFWRAVAQPMIPLHYDVEIHAPQNGSHVTRRNRTRPIIILSKRAQDNTKSGKQFRLSFAAGKKILEQAFRTCNEKLVLSLYLDFDAQPSDVDNFLKKFGSLIQHMVIVGPQSIDFNVFFHFLLNRCPNLKTLDCSYLRLTETRECNPDLPQYKLENLKRISLVGCTATSEALAKLFKIATNLQKVEGLNIGLKNAFISAVAGKGKVLKFEACMTTHELFPRICLNVEIREQNGGD